MVNIPRENADCGKKNNPRKYARRDIFIASSLLTFWEMGGITVGTSPKGRRASRLDQRDTDRDASYFTILLFYYLKKEKPRLVKNEVLSLDQIKLS